MSKFVKILLPFVAGAALATLAAALLVPYAYAIRGYSAVGGEWCLVLAVGLLGCKVSPALLSWVKGR